MVHRLTLLGSVAVTALSLSLSLAAASEPVGRHWVAPGTLAPVSTGMSTGTGASADFQAAVERISALGRTAAPAPSSALALAGEPFSLAALTPADAVAPDGPAAPAAAAEPARDAIDLTALRYYAATNDVARVSAEIRRIRALHPDWMPPESLFVPEGPRVDEQPLWDLYGEGRLDEVLGRIEAERVRTPGYVPSPALIDALKTAQARRAIERAASAGSWGEVLATAGAMPGLLVCANMQVLWWVAEALAETGDERRAMELYAYVLLNCDDPGERLATVQKASLVLPADGTRALIGLGRPQPNGSSEFDAVVLDDVRRRMGLAMEGSAPAPSPEEFARVEASAAAGSLDDAMLLAWYAYNRRDHRAAIDWFDRVLRREFRTKAVEGTILALRADGRAAEAKRIALDFAREDPLIAKLYIEIAASELTDDDPAPVPAPELSVMAGMVEAERSALGAQSLGWYLYNAKKPDEAREWFARSIEWDATPEGVLGLAVAENKLGRHSAVEALAAEYGDLVPTLAAFAAETRPVPNPVRARVASNRSRSQGGGRRGGPDTLMRSALKAYEAGDYEGALAGLDARRAARGETRDVATLRGWALHNAGRHKEAHQVFSRLEQEKSTKELRDGMRYSYQRMMPPRFH